MWRIHIFVTDNTFELIDAPSAWDRCLRVLRDAPRLAVDVEADSLYAYREKVCLIQVSTDERDFIIDPLAGLELAPLGKIFADPSVEKVFHAADYDLILLRGLYGWEINRLFDTMWAGRLLGFTRMGLAWFLESLYGITVSKKCQKADWSKRPLSAEKLAYARNDTHYLLRMRDDLEARLREEGLQEEAMEVFQDLCHLDLPERTFNPEDFWRIKGTRTLSPRALAVLKALFVFRDREAKRRDVPPFKVLNNQVMVQLAEQAAQWNGALPDKSASIPGVPSKLLERLQPGIMKALKQGLAAPPPKQTRAKRSSNSGYWQRHEILMAWRKDAAHARGVESDVILSRKAIEEIADKNPRSLEELQAVESLGPWRFERYGEAILHALDQE